MARLFKEVYEGTAKLERINLAQIVMILKKGTPSRIDNYRPIALLNNSLKIISMVLTNRVALLMRDSIGDYQSGFIKGRSILEGVATTKEVIHQCRKTSTNGNLLKLDF